MDFRRLRVGEYLTATSGLLLVTALFGPWYGTGSRDLTAWETFSVLDVVFLLLGLSALAVALLTATQRTPAVGMAGDSLLLLVALPVAVIALVRFLNLPGVADELDAGRSLFSYLGTLAVLGVTLGALVSMRDERLSDPDHPSDATGAPTGSQPEVERLPAPARAQ